MPVNHSRVEYATEYGFEPDFWVEYPSGLIDLTRSQHLQSDSQPPELKLDVQWEVPVNGERVLRLNKSSTAFVIVDMQNFFLHPDCRNHPTGLACVEPLMKVITTLREQGIKILWLNWGLTEHELKTIPPTLARSFMRGRGGLGTEMPGDFGRLLMRGSYNAELYGPLQAEYVKGKEVGSDVWIHKNRISGLWGYQSALDLFLKENGISTLFFAGVNADQCVLGTLADAYFRGYDCILVEDCTATTSPEGGLANVVHNAGNTYGFVTDSKRIVGSV